MTSAATTSLQTSSSSVTQRSNSCSSEDTPSIDGSDVNSKNREDTGFGVDPFNKEDARFCKWDIMVLLLLVVVGLFTRFRHIEYPNEIVFDEVHFGGFTCAYLKREHFFDIHPPLGKLLLWAVAKQINGFNCSFDFSAIGKPYPDNNYVYLRSLPALSSALQVPLLYLCCRELGLSVLASTICGIFLGFDLATIGDCRFILTDSFMFFFILLTFYCCLRLWKSIENSPTHSKASSSWSFWFWTICAGISMGCLTSVRWTGFASLVVYLLIHLSKTRSIFSTEQHISNQKTQKIYYVLSLIFSISVAVIVYVLFWKIHYSILILSGSGDPWMSVSFQSTLINSTVSLPITEEPPGFLATLVEVHRQMYSAIAGLDVPHFWGSHWASWPFLMKGIMFWQKFLADGSRSIIYLIGTPIVWWTTTLSIITFLSLLISKVYQEEPLTRREKHYFELGCWLVLGYVLNWSPASRITRVCFLYHYLPALYFNIILFGLVFDFLIGKQKVRIGCFLTLAVCSALGWWYWGPFVYGNWMTASEHDARKWLPSWQ